MQKTATAVTKPSAQLATGSTFAKKRTPDGVKIEEQDYIAITTGEVRAAALRPAISADGNLENIDV